MKKKQPTKAWVVGQCKGLASHVLARRLASPEAVGDKPKGNATTIEWIKWYGQLRAWIWSEGEGVSTDKRNDAEERLLKAQFSEPEMARLWDGNTRPVYPKGLHALMWFRAKSWLVDWLAARLEALRSAASAGELPEMIKNPTELLERLESELAHQLSVMAFVACYEGAGLPREAESDEPDMPAWVEDIDPMDLFQIHSAFMEVNAGRMEALDAIVPPERGRPLLSGDGASHAPSKPMSWNIFLGTMATRLKIDPSTLARDHSLVGLLAQVRVSAPTMDMDQ